MKIAIDAGALGIRDERLKVGVYRVTVNVLRELGKIDKANSYSLYSFEPIDKALMGEFGSRMINKVLRPKRGWSTLRLPLELKFNPVDVFLGLSQTIPVSKSYNIGFVYDLGFLHYPFLYPGSQEKLTQMTDNLVKRSDQIVTISHVVKNDIINRYGIVPEKITVAYPGVDETFLPEGRVHKSTRPYFLFVGSLKPGKNIPFLLRGFAKFLEGNNKKADLYLVGGDYWKDLGIDREIERLRIGEYVRKIGFVLDEELASYYRGATAFVSPSLYEGFCLPVIEAMAFGCPVIGSTAGAFPEVVGDSGLLVDPQSMDDLSHAMAKVFMDKKLRKNLQERGIKKAKKFTWEGFARKIHALIQSAPISSA